MRVTDAFLIWSCFVFQINSINCDGFYKIVAPRTIQSQHSYHASVFIFDTRDTVTIKIDIIGPSYSVSKSVQLEGPNDINEVIFRLPNLVAGDYKLIAEGTSGLIFTNSTQLSFKDAKDYTQIQTDRTTYKPGDIVNYRIIFLDTNFKPNLDENNIRIWFEDAKSNRLKELKLSEVPNGVYTDQFKVPEQAILGNWSLKVQTGVNESPTIALFNVEKVYVSMIELDIVVKPLVSLKNEFLRAVIRGRTKAGRPVNGTVHIKMELPELRDVPGSFPLLISGNMVQGEFTFRLDMQSFHEFLPSSADFWLTYIEANFRENATGLKGFADDVITLARNRYKIVCYGSCETFVPQEEKEFSVKVTSIDGSPLTSSAVMLSLTEATKSDDQLKVFPNNNIFFVCHLNESSQVTFKVTLEELQVNETSQYLYIVEIKYADEGLKPFESHPTESSAGLYKARLPRSKVDTEWLNQSLIDSDFSEYSESIEELSPVPETKRVSLINPRYRSVSEADATVAQHPIEIIAPAEVPPGAVISLEIRAAPNSFIGLFAVAQSAIVLEKKAHTYLNPNGLYNSSASIQQILCSKSDLVVMTNVHNTQNKEESEQMSERSMRQKNDKSTDRNPADTWIFENVYNNESGVIHLKQTVPHALNSWVLTAFAVSPGSGLAVTQRELQMRTVKSFFMSVNLPHSIKLDEVIRVPVGVCNYLTAELNVKITLSNKDNEFELVGESNKLTQPLVVAVGKESIAYFKLRPKVQGKIWLNFTVKHAERSQVVNKMLKVGLNGVTVKKNRAVLLYLKNESSTFEGSLEMQLPKKIVAKSQRITFGAANNVLGPFVSVFDRLMLAQSGSSQHALFKLVASHLMHDHIKGNGNLTALEQRFRGYAEQSYRDMYYFRNDNGSYNAFGATNLNAGSTWLTAHMLRYMEHMKDLVYLDERQLEQSHQFLLSQQLPTGNFTESNKYFAKMCSGLMLTANGLLALLEQREPNKLAIDRAVAYLSDHLKGNHSNNLISKSMAIYALQRAKFKDTVKLVLSLRALGKYENNRIWWTDEDGINGIHITAYALLTLIETNLETHELILSSVIWLVEQSYSYSEFIAMSNALIALQALIKYANLTSHLPLASWNVSVSSGADKQNAELISVTGDNQFVLRSKQFPPGTESVSYSVKGKGFGQMQIKSQFNVIELDSTAAYKITKQVKGDALKLELHISIGLLKVKVSNLAVLKVSLPSGYVVEGEQLPKLQESKHVGLVETKDENTLLIIYFEPLPALEPFKIVANKIYAVDQLKAASIDVHDFCDLNKRSIDQYEVK